MTTIEKLPARKIKRGPLSVRNLYAAELGQLLEVETDTHQIRWRKGTAILYGDPETQSAIALEGGRKGRASGDDGGLTPKVAKLFQDWSGRLVRKARDDTAKFQRPFWMAYGQVHRFDYWSDKKGRSTEYTHDTDARLYRYGGTRPPWIWVIRGPKLRITSRGFVG